MALHVLTKPSRPKEKPQAALRLGGKERAARRLRRCPSERELGHDAATAHHSLHGLHAAHALHHLHEAAALHLLHHLLHLLELLEQAVDFLDLHARA
eukprot:135335_1